MQLQPGKTVRKYLVNKQFIHFTPEIRANCLNTLTPEQDSIAKRIVDGMPKWSPGGTKDQLREIEYSIPIHFRNIPTE